MELDQFGARPYFDSNIIIYCLEGYEIFQPFFDRLLISLDQGKLAAVTSLLALGEILIMPKKLRLAELEMKYYSFLYDGGSFNVKNMNMDIMDYAADLCVKYGLRLPDGIHLATSVKNQCTSFFTHDKAFKNITEIPVIQLSNIAIK